MGETTTEYIHIVVNTIIFCSAIGLLVLFLSVLGKYNRGEIESQRNKTSVAMDTEYGYSNDLVYMFGSEIFTDIINQNKELPIYLNGVLIDDDYLKNVRENNTLYVSDLRGRINFNDEYLIRHTYYSNNEIKAVYYEHR